MKAAVLLSVLFAALAGPVSARAGAVTDAGAVAAVAAAAVEDIQVGYVDMPPLAWNRRGNPSRPDGVAVDVLALVAKRAGWKVHYRKLSLENILAGLAARKLHLGIVPSQPGRQWQPWVSAVAHSAPYLETVAAVALPGPGDKGERGHASQSKTGLRDELSRWAGALLPAFVIGLLGIVGLSLIVVLANLRVPRAAGKWHPESLRVVSLDPTVAAGRSAVRWLWASTSGRVLMAVWFLGCGGATLASCPPRPAGRALDDRGTIAVLRDVADGADVIGVRNDGAAFACADTIRCLEDLQRGQLKAVAGDVDRLCHELRREHMDEIHFLEGYIWPRQYTFVASSGSLVRRQLDAALLQVQLDDAESMRHIRKHHGIAWDPPLLSTTCPIGHEDD